MNWKITIALTASVCLAATLSACRQAPRDNAEAGSVSTGRAAQDANPKWTVAWSQLKPNTDAVQVLSLLGEPQQVKITKASTFWYYSSRGAQGPYVAFSTREMHVERWRTPERR